MIKKFIFYVCLLIFTIGIVGGMIVILKELSLEATITILMFLIAIILVKLRLKYYEKK